MLTPNGIRTALKAIEDKTGRDTFGKLSVYPEYVSVWEMVPGSLSGEEPVSLKNFNWDALPSLLALAEKKLNVDKPTSRHLWLQLPNKFTHSAVGMAVYLSNDYGELGYVVTYPEGNVTKVFPFDG